MRCLQCNVQYVHLCHGLCGCFKGKATGANSVFGLSRRGKRIRLSSTATLQRRGLTTLPIVQARARNPAKVHHDYPLGWRDDAYDDAEARPAKATGHGSFTAHHELAQALNIFSPPGSNNLAPSQRRESRQFIRQWRRRGREA